MTTDRGSSLEDDPRGKVPGNAVGAVLLADEIKFFCTSPDISPSQRMIDPFEPAQLRPSSYQLALGRELHLGGQPQILRDAAPLVLEPHQVAVVTTREILRIPRFLVARWSLRVQKIYEGLLWTGGPQVDPGWVGQLLCPIYNLSERDVELLLDDGFFTIDFIRTTPLTSEYMNLAKDPEYRRTWFVPVRSTLSDHDSNRLHSAPYEKLRDLGDLTRFREFATGAITVMFVLLGIMVAGLGVVAVKPTVDPSGSFLSFWPMTSLVASAIALLLAIVSLVLTLKILFRGRR